VNTNNCASSTSTSASSSSFHERLLLVHGRNPGSWEETLQFSLLDTVVIGFVFVIGLMFSFSLQRRQSSEARLIREQ